MEWFRWNFVFQSTVLMEKGGKMLVKYSTFQSVQKWSLLCPPVIVRPFRFFPFICWRIELGSTALEDLWRQQWIGFKRRSTSTQVQSRVREAKIALLGLAARTAHKTNSASLKERRNFRNYALEHQFFTSFLRGWKIGKDCFMIDTVVRGKGCSFEIFQRASSLTHFAQQYLCLLGRYLFRGSLSLRLQSEFHLTLSTAFSQVSNLM